MQHQAHIGPVHAHAKGHRGHQHRRRMVLEMGQGQAAALRIHAGVIGDRLDAGTGQPGRPALHRAAGSGVDQHGPPGLGQGREHVRQGIGRSAPHGVGKVVAPGRMHLKQRPTQLQHPDQVGPHPRRRRGAEGHQGHPGAEAAQLAQAPVVGPEIVAPGADAVGLIHGQPHQVALVLDVLQQAAGGFPLQALGG